MARRELGDSGTDSDYSRALEVAPPDWAGRSEAERLLRLKGS